MARLSVNRMPALCSTSRDGEMIPFSGMVGPQRGIREPGGCAIFFANQFFLGKVLGFSEAPKFARLVMQAFGEGLRETITQCFSS